MNSTNSRLGKSRLQRGGNDIIPNGITNSELLNIANGAKSLNTLNDKVVQTEQEVGSKLKDLISQTELLLNYLLKLQKDVANDLTNAAKDVSLAANAAEDVSSATNGDTKNTQISEQHSISQLGGRRRGSKKAYKKESKKSSKASQKDGARRRGPKKASKKGSKKASKASQKGGARRRASKKSSKNSKKSSKRRSRK